MVCSAWGARGRHVHVQGGLRSWNIGRLLGLIEGDACGRSAFLHFSMFPLLFFSLPVLLLPARLPLGSGQLFFSQPVVLQWVRIGSFCSSSVSVFQAAFAIVSSASFCSSLLALACWIFVQLSGVFARVAFQLGLRVCEPPKIGRRALREAALPLLNHAIAPYDT